MKAKHIISPSIAFPTLSVNKASLYNKIYSVPVPQSPFFVCELINKIYPAFLFDQTLTNVESVFFKNLTKKTVELFKIPSSMSRKAK